MTRTVSIEKYLEALYKWNDSIDKLQERVDKWYAKYLEAEKRIEGLTGEKFSDRNHTALQQRAEQAEARCEELTKQIHKLQMIGRFHRVHPENVASYSGDNPFDFTKRLVKKMAEWRELLQWRSTTFIHVCAEMEEMEKEWTERWNRTLGQARNTNV